MLDSTLDRILLSKAAGSQLPVAEIDVPATSPELIKQTNTPEAEVRLVVKFTLEEQIVYKGRVEQVNLLDSEELSRVVSKVAWNESKESENSKNNGDNNKAQSKDEGSQEKPDENPDEKESKGVSKDNNNHNNIEEDPKEDVPDPNENHDTNESSESQPDQPEILPSKLELYDCTSNVTPTEAKDCDSNKHPDLSESETDEAKKIVSLVIDKVFREQENHIKSLQRKAQLSSEEKTAITLEHTKSHSSPDSKCNTNLETKEVVDIFEEKEVKINNVQDDLKEKINIQTTDKDKIEDEIEEETNNFSGMFLMKEVKWKKENGVKEEGVIEEVNVEEEMEVNSVEIEIPNSCSNGLVVETQDENPQQNDVNSTIIFKIEQTQPKLQLESPLKTTDKKEDINMLKEAGESRSNASSLRRKASSSQGKRPRKIVKEQRTPARQYGNRSLDSSTGTNNRQSSGRVATSISLLADNQQERTTCHRIFAKWTDNHFYPGTIIKYTRDKKFSVRFEDGATRNVSETDLIPMNNTIGKQVRLSISKNYCVNAVVHAQIPSVNEQPMFEVEYQQDGVLTKKLVQFKEIFLTGDQGTSLVCQPDRSSGGSNFADVDLDNIIYEKRCRRLQEMEGFEFVENSADGGRRKRGQYNRGSTPKTKHSSTSPTDLDAESTKNLEQDVKMPAEEKIIEDKTNQEVLKPTPIVSNPTTGSSTSGAENVPKLELDEEFYFTSTSSHRANASLLL